MAYGSARPETNEQAAASGGAAITGAAKEETDALALSHSCDAESDPSAVTSALVEATAPEASADVLAAPRKAVVMREIEIQKAKVREKFALLKALEDEDLGRQDQQKSHQLQHTAQYPARQRARSQPTQPYAELDSIRAELDCHELNEPVFPEWLSRRQDFQCVFPRYSSEPIETEDLVLFGMDKEVKLRTSMDVDTTVRFIQRFSMFKDMSPDLCRSLTKFMHVTRRKTGTALFQQGEAANAVYFILRGCVDLYRHNDADQEASAGPFQRLRRGECCGTEALSLDLDRTNQFEARCVAVDDLGGGVQGSQDRSEANLLDEGPLSSGSVGAGQFAGAQGGDSGEVVLLALSGQDCRATTKVYLQSQHARLSKFLQTQVPLFQGWSKHRVNQVAPLLVERRFRPGDIIQRTGDPAGDLFFVYEGTCDAEREVSRVRTNRWPKALSREPASRGIEHEQRETRMVKSVKLAELRPGTYFGEESLIGYAKRRTTVLATRMTTLLCLAQTNLHEMFSTRMVQDIKQRHDALFTSDEEILAEHDHARRLEREYELLKRAAFGPAYLRRAQRNQAGGGQIGPSHSAPLLATAASSSSSLVVQKSGPKPGDRASGTSLTPNFGHRRRAKGLTSASAADLHPAKKKLSSSKARGASSTTALPDLHRTHLR